MHPLRATLLAALLATFACLQARAVHLGEDARGQALVFPYYTVQSGYNTWLTVVNHTTDAKALRVRLREPRGSREVLSFNLYLSAHDAWAGAIVPGSGDAPPRLVTVDHSCTSPVLDPAAGLALRDTFYSGVYDDGNGAGPDRARTGFAEMIEMATLTGASASDVTHGPDGYPANCGALQGNATPYVAAPSGGLSGSLTLVHVANGLDFSVNAVALDALATRPFLRPAVDPYPDFNAVEIRPVSTVVSQGIVYRSVWNRPVDAVSAALMRTRLAGEYGIEPATAAKTAFVATFPTRQFYASPVQAVPPFTAPGRWSDRCTGNASTEPATLTAFDRDEAIASSRQARFCAAVVVFDVAAPGADAASTPLLGGLAPAATLPIVELPPPFVGGWLDVHFDGAGATAGLASLPGSTAIDDATGLASPGDHGFEGLPVVGFAMRTFLNRSLACASGPCEGSYAAALPFRFERRIRAQGRIEAIPR